MILSFGCMTLFALTEIAFLEITGKCDIVRVEMDSLNIVESP